jgi:hypothetical protein
MCSPVLRARDPSLRLKNGYAQDDAIERDSIEPKIAALP